MEFLKRTLWFLLVGWWLAFLWGALAWLLCVSVVLFNRLPQVLTLKPVEHDPWTGGPAREVAWWIRAVWFVLVGWWAGLLFFKVGYLLCLTIVGMPFGVWMLHRVPLAMTLKQAA